MSDLMPRSFAFVTFFVTAVLAASFVRAGEPLQVLLWEHNVPNALGTEEKDKPKINVYLPDKEKACGSAVVVCPGGGYSGLAMDHEGKQIAQWLNSFGVAAAVLDYRHSGKGYKHPNPLLDVQRAIRSVRHHAEDWEIAPAKIGVMGFSAGGHLASTAGTHFADHTDPKDDIDKITCRPDFMILCYPVVLFDSPYTHRGSQRNLIGKDAAEELVGYYSNEKQVTDKTPPTFIFFTDEDTGVPAENGVEFYLQLRKHKVPAELHIYQKGRHGLGLAKSVSGTETWSDLCRIWLVNNGWAK